MYALTLLKVYMTNAGYRGQRPIGGYTLSNSEMFVVVAISIAIVLIFKKINER